MKVKKNIPLCLPKLPTTEKIIPYLKKIDASRWYSNQGPLLKEFLLRMAKLFHIQPTQITTASSGTLLLELCLKAMNIKKNSLCITPAWTFVATPLAIINAHLTPVFVDVDPVTQTIDPLQLEANLPHLAHKGEIGAVIVVAPYGMPINVKDWDNFSDKTGVPVIIDAAAAFDTVLQLPQMRVSKTPIMVSLHATKIFGVGEGGMMLTTDTALINQIESLTQFGFKNSIRNAESLGTNAKVSEYTAAIGLAALDSWEKTRTAWEKLATQYQQLLNMLEIKHLFTHQWLSSTCNIIVPYQADAIANTLENSGVMARKWYGDGCHHHTVFKSALATELPNTEYLRKSTLGLPFYLNINIDDINTVIDQLAIACAICA
ncbi:MAG: hypothetical protein A3E83_01680 [Gammaproteobacteria bacterium RIFCSPHIGHO2_12_FULL_41_20]|nr:MAG: hypothetical protein A3E83_01680 [Gammaproteobacteria bacterium RIFCSPHIGHO2_12_FULL_41_20]